MIKKFNDFVNESIKDAMKPKSDKDIEAALSDKSKEEIIKLYLKSKNNFLLKYLYDKFNIEKNPLNLDIVEILKGYLTAALWTEELDDKFDIEDGDENFINKSKNDIELFVHLAGDLLKDIEESDIGHDLWLTRNGHGAGFWDRNYIDKEQGERLSDIASALGEVYIEEGYYNDED